MSNRNACSCAKCRARNLNDFAAIIAANYSRTERAELLNNARADNVSNVVERVASSIGKGN